MCENGDSSEAGDSGDDGALVTGEEGVGLLEDYDGCDSETSLRTNSQTATKMKMGRKRKRGKRSWRLSVNRESWIARRPEIVNWSTRRCNRGKWRCLSCPHWRN